MFTYITLEQAVEIHAKTIQVSGGGVFDPLNLDKLDSVLEHIQNDDYYPSIEEKLTHLFFSVNKFHCFADGNKRIALALCVHFLNINGYCCCLNHIIRELENISRHVAAGLIDKELLGEIIYAVINQEYDNNESLKLKIITVIS
jgi:death on curing protein